jgi:hypothetical protein
MIGPTKVKRKGIPACDMQLPQNGGDVARIFQKCWECGCRGPYPVFRIVSKDARAGLHEACGVNLRSKRTPHAARASKFGVTERRSP